MVLMPSQLMEVTDDSSSDDEDIQLFSFNATTNINNGGGRPKRTLKAVARFESSTFTRRSHHLSVKLEKDFHVRVVQPFVLTIQNNAKNVTLNVIMKRG